MFEWLKKLLPKPDAPIDRNDIAFKSGKRDFHRGVEINPYPQQSSSSGLWEFGWKEEFERKQADEAW